MSLEIHIFQPEHASRFAQLNREWLEKYNLMESSNEEPLLTLRRISSVAMVKFLSRFTTPAL